jgi:hypothetical protein
VPTAEVRAVTAVDEALRGDLLSCWTDVTNAGGAVGFVPPVTPEDVVPLLDKLLDGVSSGRDVLALLTVDGATAGFASVVGSLSPLRRHWGTVLACRCTPPARARAWAGCSWPACTTSPAPAAGSSCT